MKHAITMVAGVAGLLVASLAQAAAAPSIGAPAPEFSLQDQNGKTVKLDDLKGKIVVLEWTNPACPFVQRHYREKTMTTLADEYKDKGVVWIAINSTNGDTSQANRQWAKEQGIDYPILDDAAGVTGKHYGAKSTPDMFIIDKQGNLAYEGAIDNDPNGSKGASRINYVKQALDEILAGKTVSVPKTKSYGCGVHYAD